MAVSKAQQASVNKYVKANYDRINVTFPKGQKDILRDHAAARGESVNSFIGRAVAETMERDGSGTASEIAQQAAGTTQGAGVVSLPPETLEAAQRAADAGGDGLPQYAQDPIYCELVSLCEQCGIMVKYATTGVCCYARTDGSSIQMGADSEYRNAEHATIVLGHELAHTLEDSYHLNRSDLAKYEIVPYPNDDIEDLCDCWGVALYKLASLIYDKKISDLWGKLDQGSTGGEAINGD